MAPTLEAAMRPMIASGMFDTMAATRSPGFTPASRKAWDSRDTASYTSRKVRVRFTLFSPRKIIAGSSSLRRSRFSA